MSRNKKQRRSGSFMAVLEQKPRKQERLADPDSKESRKQRALRNSKKHKSVYEKAQATQSRMERDAEAGRKGTRHGGPLAEKIRRLNSEKQESEDS
ncbi:hypothetical protein KQ940_00785 [Marinobacterium sp. D7]|uniref:hypothetical protein n=1 Tax=Marinobacterium ramblicola TaxID=2849041 RepID=UPI001C2D22F7|nr:hypothetical protein [Marinobacterium ramblicola]MBV1786583.1 hypothetical protein [Marinobacterium ramblicola]